MNVSSLRNINGDSFSAVQDAALTDVVQTNSGNWQDITAYQNASGTYLTSHQSLADYATTAELALKQDTLTFDYDEQNKISAINNSAIAGGSNFSGITYIGSYIDGNEETVNYTAVATGIGTAYDGVISHIKFTSGNNSNINKYLMAKRLDNDTIASGTEGGQPFRMAINPSNTPFTYTAGIFAPLKYATGACLTYGSTGSPGWSVDTATNQYYGAFFKGNEIFISNAMTNTNQALRLETHNSRGVHISGANMRSSGYFDVSVNGLKFGNYNTATSSWETCNYNKAAYDRWNEVSSKLDNSALEYNAVDEISGIAGSAIAQYGAEKQWLVHDDTLVHAANSAQYALGVAIDNVSRLMGVDETVLYSGTSNTSPITASEQLSSFEKVEIVWEHNYNNTVVNHFNYTYQMPSNELFAYGGRTGGNGFAWFLAAWTIGSDGKTLTRTQSKYIPITTTVGTPTDNTNLFPIKIVGIGRKQ